MKQDTLELFREVVKKSMYFMHAKLESMGLYRGQPKMLFLLDKEDGLTKKELAERFEVSAPTVTKMVERLEKNGFLTTKKDEKDKRITRVYISDKGRSQLHELRDFRSEAADIYFKDMSDEEIETLNTLLEKVKKNISEHKEVCCGKNV